MKHTNLKIGRAQDNDIVLTHHSVSRYHLEVFIDDQGFVFITDLNSSNGTYVNGNKIEGSTLLNKGDILKLGADKPLQWQRWVQHTAEGDSQGESINNVPNFHQLPKNRSIIVIALSILAGLIFLLIVYVVYHNIKRKSAIAESNPFNQTSIENSKNEETIPNSKEENQSPTVSAPLPKKSTKRSESINYDYSCLSDPNDKNETDVLNNGSDVNDLVLDAFGDVVEVSDEVQYGNDLHNDLLKKYNFIFSGSSYQNLQQILSNLTSYIINPRGFNYKLFLIQSDELNAFTAGGRIYITTKMYNFCQSNDELACVIGHEINHNELGHIKNNIKMASMPGGAILMLVTTPFNQKKETACDLHGIDLAISAGYEGCASVLVWKRMSEQADSNNYDPLENLFRSHPYSSKREGCSKNHILVNYSNSPCAP